MSTKVEKGVFPPAASCLGAEESSPKSCFEGAIPSWRKVLVSEEEAFQRMIKNAKKAMVEHQAKHPETRVYVTREQFDRMAAAVSVESSRQTLPPGMIQYYLSASIGRRITMQDVHFCDKTEWGILVGVFDGHGPELATATDGSSYNPGLDVAKKASDKFREWFPEALQAGRGNVFQAFEVTFDKIQKDILSEKIAGAHRYSGGSTAVICFIDNTSHMLYTATIGDSEANIYRRIGGRLTSIPLSCVRDWTSKKDLARGEAKIQEHPGRYWFEQPEDAKKRFYCIPVGLNVSRAFGDREFYEHGCVIAKPKITVNLLQTGDMIVLASDGLKDFVPEEEICQKLGSKKTPHARVSHAFRRGSSEEDIRQLLSKSPARDLVECAVGVRHSDDNVTVMVLGFCC